MLGWFSEKKSLRQRVDIHSHLLPGLDDGVKSYEEALEILRVFQDLGYEKVITTPHIYHDHYPNTPENIQQRYEVLREKVDQTDLRIDLEVAAEYFIDEHFLEFIDNRVLSFGKGYVLVETAFYTKPLIFDEAIFKLKSAGFTPVLAHPERYLYLKEDFSWLQEIYQSGVKLQVTATSFVGAYGSKPREIAEKLWNRGLVDFLGSDIHRASQTKTLKRALNRKLKPQKLLNEELI